MGRLANLPEVIAEYVPAKLWEEGLRKTRASLGCQNTAKNREEEGEAPTWGKVDLRITSQKGAPQRLQEKQREINLIE